MTNRGWHRGGGSGDKRAKICYSGNTAEGALEIEVVEDLVMYGSEPLEFEQDVLCTEPLKESDFVVVQERLLEDVGDSLTLLCMRQRVVNVARNGRLNVR